MDIEDLRVTVRPTCDARCARTTLVTPERHRVEGFQPTKESAEDDIVSDARRCIFCYDPPCNTCCPSNIDVREFVHAASTRNWYYAAKVILSSNPMPLSTAAICAVEELCQGGCNLKDTIGGSIKTNLIQQYALRMFRSYNIKPTVPGSIGKKVAVVGAGPAGMSCAAFLRRFGIEVTIFEAESFAGGLLTKELLPHRLPHEDVEFETKMLVDAGVEFKFNTKLGTDFTVESLQKDGFSAVFIAIGRPDDIEIDFPCTGAKTSHEFLFGLNKILKLKADEKLPSYQGKKVLVLGAGDTAMDCASAASRLGGNVTVAFRKDIDNMRAHPKEVEELMRQGVDFMPLAAPTAIENGTVTFRLQEKTVDGKFVAAPECITRKYDEVILAFGAKLGKTKEILPGEIKQQTIAGLNNVFVGGDLANSVSVVEAVNDGRTAARMIADYLGEKGPIPLFTTEVDTVSLETEFDGLKFKNPCGISSAPISGTYECIRNCFKAGFGWAVTKTILLTKDVQRENDFRIVKCDTAPGPSGSYANICMMTEHSCEYWIDTIKKLKTEYPDRVLIASISAQDNKADWQELVRRTIEAGADGLELNLSCPNEVHGQGGHTGGFDTENKIGMALGQHPTSVKRICEYISEVTTVPFYAKLTPNITDPIDIARGATAGKANGVAMINTVSGIAKFFPDGTPLPQVGKSKFVLSGGLSGDQVRPIALRQVAKVHNDQPEMPILGIGGISSGDTALQHLYAGSNVFQICSAVQRFSYEIVKEINAGLQFYMYSWSRPDLRSMLSRGVDQLTMPHATPKDVDTVQDRKVPTLAELRGLGAKRVVQRESFEPVWTLNALIDNEKCIKCGKCALSCRDNSTEAIARQEDGSWKVTPEKCIGCALCMSVCPVYAINMVNVSDKKWHHKEDDE